MMPANSTGKERIMGRWKNLSVIIVSFSCSCSYSCSCSCSFSCRVRSIKIKRKRKRKRKRKMKIKIKSIRNLFRDTDKRNFGHLRHTRTRDKAAPEKNPLRKTRFLPESENRNRYHPYPPIHFLSLMNTQDK